MFFFENSYFYNKNVFNKKVSPIFKNIFFGLTFKYIIMYFYVCIKYHSIKLISKPIIKKSDQKEFPNFNLLWNLYRDIKIKKQFEEKKHPGTPVLWSQIIIWND